MVTSKQCLAKYGDPNLLETQNKHFEVWQVPKIFLEKFSHVRFSAVGTIGFPKRIFINKDFRPLLEKALQNLIDRGLEKELKTWDGVFIIRQKRGLSSLSLHSWALAVDVNASENALNATPKLSKEFVKCFTDVGLEWGGNWSRKDGMHFQIGVLPNNQTNTTPTQENIYIVKSGDTLSKIATQFRTTITKIKKDNSLTSDLIKVGQKLKI
jgi:LysM repeat protein